MNISDLSKKIINTLYLNGEELSTKEVANILKVSEEEVISKSKEIEIALANIGLSLIVNNSKLSINSLSSFFEVTAAYQDRLNTNDLSPAQLQVITIVAYLEEVGAADVSFIRGVQSSQTIRLLTTLGLLEKMNDKYKLTLESLQILGIKNNAELKDHTTLKEKLLSKMDEALNG